MGNIHQSETLVTVADVLAGKGWEVEEHDELFQKNIIFTTRSKLGIHDAQISHIGNMLTLELLVQISPVQAFLRNEFLRLLNLINQEIVGTICHMVETDEEGYTSEFIIYRSQLHFDGEIGLTENPISHFVDIAVSSYELCLPNIAVFLTTKPHFRLNKDQEVCGMPLRVTPEEIMDSILYGSPAGFA